MKKIIAIILMLTACVSLCACAKPDSGNPDNGEGTAGAPCEVISDTMTRYNCKSGNGYDKSVKEENGSWVTRHDGFELGNLELYGCEKTEDGYKVVNQEEFGIKYKVTQNLGSLVNEDGTMNGAESFWVNRDESTKACGTDISSAIGVGAYYVKIKYTDGTEKSFSKTNFFENAQKGMALDILTVSDLTKGKTVDTVDVTLLYETYAGAPGFLDIWWHEYANWRCEYTYNFEVAPEV